MDDRRVHIRLRGGREVVRYDRAGKWYIEWPDGNRRHLHLSDAVSWATEEGATVFFRIPGGSRFDALVQTTQGGDHD